MTAGEDEEGNPMKTGEIDRTLPEVETDDMFGDLLREEEDKDLPPLTRDSTFTPMEDGHGNVTVLSGFHYHCRECSQRFYVQALLKQYGDKIYWFRTKNGCLNCGLEFNGVSAIGDRWVTEMFTNDDDGFTAKFLIGPQRKGRGGKNKGRSSKKKVKSIEITCPNCGAKPGEKCEGPRDRSHGARIRRARKAKRS